VKKLRARIQPDEVLLVADGALGQEAVTSQDLPRGAALTGLILTKLDGDTRGGAALSIKAVTGVPIKFIGTGEKTADFEPFIRTGSRNASSAWRCRVAGREGAGDDRPEGSREVAEALRKGDFNLTTSWRKCSRSRNSARCRASWHDSRHERRADPGRCRGADGRTEAIIKSMTKQERRKPDILNGSRRQRIANGAGVKIVEVNQLLKQFQQMQKMMSSSKRRCQAHDEADGSHAP